MNVSPEHIAAKAGYDLAHRANNAFDSLQAAQARLDSAVITEDNQEINNNVDLYRYRLKQLAGAADALIARGKLGSNIFAEKPVDYWGTLSAEQRKYAERVHKALAEKFHLDPNEIGLVKTNDDAGKEQLVMMHIAPRGLYAGSLDHIRIGNRAFMIEVDGATIDTREGMTRAVYKSFIDDAKMRGVHPLPDSNLLAITDGEGASVTLLSVLNSRDNKLSAGCVGLDGEASERSIFSNDDDLSVRFRPVVPIHVA